MEYLFRLISLSQSQRLGAARLFFIGESEQAFHSILNTSIHIKVQLLRLSGSPEVALILFVVEDDNNTMGRRQGKQEDMCNHTDRREREPAEELDQYLS